MGARTRRRSPIDGTSLMGQTQRLIDAIPGHRHRVSHAQQIIFPGFSQLEASHRLTRIFLYAARADMNQISVILAEDHLEMAEHLRTLLEPCHSVEVVSEGQALLAAVSRKLPDVIIVDITMPGMNGLVAAARILALHPHARIICSTVRNEPAIIERALSEGVLGYVMKADAGEELVEAVQAVLNGSRYVSCSARAALATR